MSRRVAIIEAKRTPIGRFLGAFRNTTAVELGTAAVSGVMELAGIDPAEVDQVIMGHARQAGCGPNPARQVSHNAGVPNDKPAFTLNMACASGMQAVALATQAIATERADCAVAGGMENMTRVPYMLDKARLGYRLGDGPLIDLMYRDGFGDPLSEMLMGETAEVLAEEYDISREQQDRFAMESQQRVERANAAGVFAQEIITVTAKDDRGRDVVVDADEHPRAGVTMDTLAKLPPVFKKDGGVTAGNASGITDGAAALVLMSEDKAKALGKTPLGFVRDFSVVGVEPQRMGIGPVPATAQLLDRHGMSLDDVPLIELNEAFAAQVLACQRDMNLDMERVNVQGGAISLGHPIGATGARIIVTLLHELQRRGDDTGLATLCVSGGLGMALLVDRN